MDSQPLPALARDLQFTVHRQGDELWYAVTQPQSKRFIRLGRTEYLIACALNGKRTADEVIAEVEQLDAGETNALEVQQLVGWLSQVGFVETGSASGADSVDHSQVVLNPLYSRFPLVSGDQLERVAGKLQFLTSRWCVGLIGLAILVASMLLPANWDRFASILSKLFVPDAQFWWVLAWLFLKATHELGHAIVAVRIGSRIRSAGISLIFLAPIPYVDISDMWTVANRWHRMWCCAGGMLCEIGLAAVAALIALSTENTTLQYFCCAVASLGTFSTLAFNANPLMRFDGYFILSDLLNRQNLWTEGQTAVKTFWQRLRHPLRPATSPLRLSMLCYGSACYAYRTIMLVTIAVWAILMWQGIGAAIVVWGAYAALVVPWQRRRQAVKAQMALAPRQTSVWQEWSWGGVAASCLVAGVCWLPSPIQPVTPGVIAFHDPITLRVESPGFLQSIHVAPDSAIEQGELIAILRNPELELELAQKRLEVEATRESIRSLRSQGSLAELQTHQSKLMTLTTQCGQLQTRVAQLRIVAPGSGTLVEFDLHRQQGKYLNPGEPICVIANPDALEVKASARQSDAQRLRESLGQSVEIWHTAGPRFTGTLEKVDPRGGERLSEPALAAIYGGCIPVEATRDDGDALKLTSPRFDVSIALDRRLASSGPGQRVWVRVPGESASLLQAVQHWCQLKWQQLQDQSRPG